MWWLSLLCYGWAQEPLIYKVPKVQIIGKVKKSGLSSAPPAWTKEEQSLSTQFKIAEESTLRPLPKIGALAPDQYSLYGLDPIQNQTFVEDVPLQDGVLQQLKFLTPPSEIIERLEVGRDYPDQALGLGGSFRYRLLEKAESHVTTQFGSFWERKVSGLTPVGSNAWLWMGYHESDENFRFLDDKGTPHLTDDDAWVERTNNKFSSIHLVSKIRFSQSASWFGYFQGLKQGFPGSIYSPSSTSLKQLKGLSAYQYGLGSEKILSLFLRFERGDLQDFSSFIGGYIPDSTVYWSPGLNVQFPTRLTSQLHLRPWVGATYEHYATHYSLTGASEKDRELSLFRFDWGGKFELSSGSHRFGGELVGQTHLSPIRNSLPVHSYLSPRVTYEASFHPSLKGRFCLAFLSRPPALAERFGNGQQLVENLELKSETAFKGSVEASMDLSAVNRVVSEVRPSFFFISARNLIQLGQVAQQRYRAYNEEDVSLMGSELSLKTHLGAWLRSYSNVQWLYTENQTKNFIYKGKSLPYRPQWHLSQLFKTNYKAVSAGYLLSWIGEQFSDEQNLFTISPQWNHSLYLSWQFQLGQLSIEVLNLTDATLASRTGDGLSVPEFRSGLVGFPSPGRRFSIAWSMNL